jgi:hypothetical protein
VALKPEYLLSDPLKKVHCPRNWMIHYGSHIPNVSKLFIPTAFLTVWWRKASKHLP